jgi:transglutaminase-like putative cysteine protease
MTMRVTWDQLFGQQRTPERPAEGPFPDSWRPAMAIGEEVLTFFLTFMALFSVVTSVEKADWVPEMPSLTRAAVIGLFSGWVLARTRVAGWALHLVGVSAGVIVVLLMVMRSIRLEFGAPDTLRERWLDLWTRNGEWLQALRAGEFSTDPLPFVLMVVFAAWFLAYLAAWAVARWRNPWLALVPGAVALLTNISYLPGQPSAELIIFLFAAILLFARVHLLRRVERWSGDNSARPAMLSLEVLNLATWVGIALIVAAWMIPTANNWGPVSSVWSAILSPITDRVDRVGQLFIGVGSKRSLGLHQFEGVLPLQGTVSLGDQQLLRIEAPESVPEELYLRGAVYDQYIGDGWKQGPLTDRPQPQIAVDVAASGNQQTRAQLRQPIPARIYLDELIARRRLMSFGEPLAASVGARIVNGAGPEDLVALAPTSDFEKGDEYQTVGTVTAASVERLLAAQADYPQWVRDRYLLIPSDLPPEVRALAQQIAAGERVPYRIAIKVEDYLRSNYEYSLEMPERSPRQDAIAHFLFDAQRGYSDYFASSMAVLLRLLGVPSRIAVGFAVDSTNLDATTKQFHITDQDSWAWTQAYFPGLGWIDFNPTPSRALIVRAGADLNATATPESILDPAPFPDDPGLLEEFEEPIDLGEGSAADERSGLARFLAGLGTWLLMASLAFVALFFAGRFAWSSAFGRFPPATQRWAKLQTFASWAGVPVRRDLTPLEEAAALGATLQRPPIDLAPLARTYVAERYGARKEPEAPEASEQLDEVYMRARQRLLRRVARRFLGGFGRERDRRERGRG